MFKIEKKPVPVIENYDNSTWEKCLKAISEFHVEIPTQVLEQKWKEYVMSDRFIPTPTNHNHS
jgi:hypothetical protein